MSAFHYRVRSCRQNNDLENECLCHIIQIDEKTSGSGITVECLFYISAKVDLQYDFA